MLTINKLLKPKSIEEAYDLLRDNPKARIIGGGAFLRLSKDLKIHTAIDLYGLNLNKIEDTGDAYIIGAMTTLRTLETHRALKDLLSPALENIVGVQLRNIATIGGSVYPKYGFSDLITGLLVLDTTLVFEGRPACTLVDYLEEVHRPPSILKHLVIQKENLEMAFYAMKNSASDFSILNVAVSACNQTYKIAVGGRPMRAKLAREAMTYLEGKPLTQDHIVKAADLASASLNFGSNRLGSADYRQAMCRVLVKRGLEALKTC